jgi:drug/metabolite transporter (DMT)-like permease
MAMRIMLHTPNRDKSVAWSISREELALVAVTMVWGGTFLAVQAGLAVSGPLFFVGSRFGVAAISLAVLSRRLLPGLTLRELGAGAAIGVAIFGGYVLQTYGLQTITSSQSAFITALYVPIVPLLQWLVLGRRPRLTSWIGIGLAFLGPCWSRDRAPAASPSDAARSSRSSARWRSPPRSS